MSKIQYPKRKSIGQMRIASIGALTITLTFLGIIALIRIVALGLEQDIKEQFSFDIELPEDYNSNSYHSLEGELQQIPGISKLYYISADEALESIEEQLGENPKNILGYNPLNPLLRINIKSEYLQTDSLQQIQSVINELGLDATSLNVHQSELLDRVNKNISAFEIVLWALVVIQAAFAFVQISNTTRLYIYAERLKIRSLTLVGASAWFIRRPIIVRSLTDGLLASILSLCFLTVGIYGIEFILDSSIISILNKTYLLIAVGGIFTLALLACSIASYRATQLYIKMDGSHIHLI